MEKFRKVLWHRNIYDTIFFKNIAIKQIKYNKYLNKVYLIVACSMSKKSLEILNL